MSFNDPLKVINKVYEKSRCQRRQAFLHLTLTISGEMSFLVLYLGWGVSAWYLSAQILERPNSGRLSAGLRGAHGVCSKGDDFIHCRFELNPSVEQSRDSVEIKGGQPVRLK